MTILAVAVYRFGRSMLTEKERTAALTNAVAISLQRAATESIYSNARFPESPYPESCAGSYLYSVCKFGFS